jgi:hypothetical protein
MKRILEPNQLMGFYRNTFYYVELRWGEGLLITLIHY